MSLCRRSSRYTKKKAGISVAKEKVKDRSVAKPGVSGKKGWQARVWGFVSSKEFLSGAIIFVFFSGALLSMFINPQFHQVGLYEGDVALKDVFAPYDFVYSWGVDQAKTDDIKRDAARAVPYVFVKDLSAEEKTFAGLKGFFSTVEKEKALDIPMTEKIRSIRDISVDDLTERDIRNLLEFQETDTLARGALSVAEKVFQAGYSSAEDLEDARKAGFSRIVIKDERTGTETERPVEKLITKEELVSVVENQVDLLFPGERRIRQPMVTVIESKLVPNITGDKGRTTKRIDAAIAAVKPVPKESEVRKNEIIVAKGQRITAQDMAQLKHISGFLRQGTTLGSFIGSVIFFFLIGLLAFAYLSFSREKNFFKDVKNTAIVVLNMSIALVLAEMVLRSPQPSYFMPLAFMGMIITLLVGVNVGFLSLMLMSVFLSVISGGNVEVMFVLFAAGTVGIYSIRDCRRRSDILRAGLFVGIAKLVAIVSVGLMNNLEAEIFIRDGFWGMASGAFSAFLVMGLLPVFEYLFKVPTNITLLELSDLNHPLLKKLSIEAPGTYHHSILVGNLAEAACDAVGANSLLARVGAYYHDIGKIPKAEYFSENEMGAPSRHDKLLPSMSALIISNHVKEGVEMAKKHKLQRNIVDLIGQHHGNSLIAYFYKKALEKSSDKSQLKEANFRYPGPRPQTRESAIILLADSVEASCRALEEPTSAGIRMLVKKIINNKFIDGQLDECDLTLKGIEKIASSFERVLIGIYHTRLNYPSSPTEKETANGKRSDANKRGRSKSDKENRPQ